MLVNKIVVEADSGGVLSGRSKINAIEPRPVDRGETHRAGLATGVENAAAQLEAFQIAAGVADRGDFGVRGGIEKTRHLVPAAANNFAVAHNDRAERSAAVFAHAGAREVDRFAHPTRVRRVIIGGIRHRRIRELS